MIADSKTANGWPVTRGYDPDAHQVGIVHIGAGAFHRAHQAVYTDDVLATSGGDWRILGVSLRSADTAAALNGQAGRYHLVVRSGQEDAHEFRVIGSVAGVLVGADGIGPILDEMTNPRVRIVSLTITEKAYAFDRQKAELDMTDPQILADLKTPEDPHSAIGLVTRALMLRKQRGHAPFSVMSCDNLPENGALLRSAVLGFAKRMDAELADWIASEVSFPSTMVDRITPACTQDLIDETHTTTGLRDLAPVETEPFSQWVIEDTFSNGRPDWHAVGAFLVDDVTPYENMKLRMLNGAHSLLAYSGFLSGQTYVRDTMNDRSLRQLINRHIRAAAATLDALDGIDFDAYGAELMQRFGNTNIAHETYQIAMDGSQKMPQRIFAPALVALERGGDFQSFAFASAAWIRYLVGVNDRGETYELRDPRQAEFSAMCAACDRDAVALVEGLNAMPNLVPPALVAHIPFQQSVQTALHQMLTAGMDAAIATVAGDIDD